MLVQERFEEKYFVAPDGCWLWTDYVWANGYACFKMNGKSRRAHRVSYELYVGYIPDGLHVDHLCGKRSCVNPYHLEAVTHTENIKRRAYTKLCEHNAGISTCNSGCKEIYLRDYKRQYMHEYRIKQRLKEEK